MPSDEEQTPWEVLVVDDEEDVRDLIVSFCSNLGMTVTGAHDGRAAISALQRSNGRYGLVITDLNLPGADGFAVLQAAKQANASVYVVIVTGYASIDSAVQAVRVGAYDYLAKPFSMGQLDVVLKRITDRARLERASQGIERDGVVRAHARPRERQVGSGTVAVDMLSFDKRLSRIETLLARIDERLESASRSPLVRR